MTRIAGGRKPSRRVGGVSGAVVIGLVAVDAGAAVQAVIVVGVALRALQVHVRARQGETGGCMIKRCTQPIGGGVAQGAILREPRRLVRGICGAVVSGQVTVDAGAACQAVIVVDVALRALQVHVRAGQSEARGRVIKRCA